MADSDHKPAFACWFYLEDISKDCELSWSRYVELPCPPSKEVTYDFQRGDDEESSGWVFRPHHIRYRVKDDAWECYGKEVTGQCPCTEANDCCKHGDDHKEWMTRSGWELDSERRGRDRLHKIEGMFGPLPDDDDPADAIPPAG